MVEVGKEKEGKRERKTGKHAQEFSLQINGRYCYKIFVEQTDIEREIEIGT